MAGVNEKPFVVSGNGHARYFAESVSDKARVHDQHHLTIPLAGNLAPSSPASEAGQCRPECFEDLLTFVDSPMPVACQ
jgi:hypothetical protein